MYASAENVRRNIAALALPPVRMPVSEAARKYVRVQSSGGASAPWDGELTPYMIEPMNLLTSRDYEAVIFVGPARTGKTLGLIDCFAGYMITCDPSDMMITQISQEKAKDFSKLRVNRMLRNSPEIGKHLSASKQDDNVHEKFFRAGNVLKISWPTVKQLSSSEFKYVVLTDYDRMPQDVDKEGSPFSLAQKRTQTYLSRGMTMAESSPGYEVIDPKWQPNTPHEAPPTRGILSLYNQGDRRRLYMCCPSCGEYFLPAPGIEAFSFKINKDLFGHTDTQITGDIGLICTECGDVINEKHKHKMLATCQWVPEGCRIDRNGDSYELTGEKRKTKTASFWMSGAAAAYQSWENIIQRYLNALREFDVNGSEEALKTTTNVDQGTAYLPRRMVSETSSADLERRAEKMNRREVPEGVRFLVAAIDVQGTRFVVQVNGYGVGFENWPVDRFDIHISNRKSDGENLQLDPAGFIEDWDLITEKVIKRRYPLADGSGRSMNILITACDSGGRAGVTDRAYNYWRNLRKSGLHKRFMLIKGERPRPDSRKPTVVKSYPDNTGRSDRTAQARGDVPVWILNTTILKDSVYADMKRDMPGPRYMHFADWLSVSFYEELIAEVRTEKGWENPGSQRNETFDLYCYQKGVIHGYMLEKRMQAIDWDAPPAWAMDWDNNSEIGTSVAEKQKPQRPAQNKTSVNMGNPFDVKDGWGF